MFGAQEVLDEQVAGGKVDTPAALDEFMTDGTQQAGLGAARIAESQHVLAPVDEVALDQGVYLEADLAVHAFEVQGPAGLFPGQPGFAHEPLDSVEAALPAFLLTQGQQIGLEARVLVAGLFGEVAEALAKRVQMQLLEVG